MLDLFALRAAMRSPELQGGRWSVHGQIVGLLQAIQRAKKSLALLAIIPSV